MIIYKNTNKKVEKYFKLIDKVINQLECMK